MISYTIDPSVFEPPSIPKNNKLKNEYKNELKKYFSVIDNCYDFIHYEGISVYIFHYVKNYFDDDYKRKANFSGLPVDKYKKKLDDIYLFNMPKLHYGERIGSEKYYFEDWFKIKILKCIETNVKPSLPMQRDDNSEIYDRINMIGIINNIVLKDSQFHHLIRKETLDNLFLESQKIDFSIKKTSYFEESLFSEIRLKQVNNFDFSYKTQYKSVLEVLNSAKELFSDYIIFGNDVEKGIKKGIRDSAGPPDRIFAYIKTLVEFCEIKRTRKIDFSDDYILQVLGCICTFEDEDAMKNEKFKKTRMFDNGNNEKIQFNLHLKPNTFRPNEDTSNKKRTVRIYTFWDDIQEKVIVGWIGNHP